MATIYALSSLANWGTDPDFDGAGWSGGLPPTSTDDVVFNSSSGAARTISGAGECHSLTCVGANAMNLPFISVYGPTCNIEGMASCYALYAGYSGPYTDLYSSNVPITLLGSNIAAANFRLNNNVTLTGSSGGGDPGLVLNGYTLTAPRFFSASSAITIDFGSGSIVLNSDTAEFTVYSSAATIIPGTGTLKFTGAGSSLKSATVYNNSKVLPNIWNATTGSGGLTFGLLTGPTVYCNQLKISAGATHLFSASVTTDVQSIVADGTASQITMKSTSSGTQASVNNHQSGLSNVDRCAVKDINMTGTALRARSSTDNGHNTNVSFISGNSNLLSFF